MSIDIGDVRQVTASFYDAGGNLGDPTAVTLEVTDPSGTKTTYTYGVDVELENPSTGIYRLNVDLTASEEWLYRFAGTGAIQAAEEKSFSVVRKLTA